MILPPRRAVFSALIGSYERPLRRPVDPSAGVDFFFFTDSATADPGPGWQIVRVDPWDCADTVRSARRIKVLGSDTLLAYDEVMWLDNRVTLKVPAAEIFDLLDGHDALFPLHSFRADVAGEFKEVIASGYDDPHRVRQMYGIAKDSGVAHQAPIWTGMFVRTLSVQSNRCMERWWEYILLTSRRDQLSINTAIAETELNVKLIHLDNIESDLHAWADLSGLGRQRRVQMWKPPKRSLGMRIGDQLRRTNVGRKAARALARVGFAPPSLPR